MCFTVIIFCKCIFWYALVAIKHQLSKWFQLSLLITGKRFWSSSYGTLNVICVVMEIIVNLSPWNRSIVMTMSLIIQLSVHGLLTTTNNDETFPQDFLIILKHLLQNSRKYWRNVCLSTTYIMISLICSNNHTIVYYPSRKG